MVKLRTFLFVVGFALPIAAADIPASNFFRPENATVTITPSSNDVVLFDELENSKYFLNGRDLTISADKIRVKGNVVISGFSTAAPSAAGQGGAGAAGQSFGQAGNCNRGSTGGHGGAGGPGPAGAAGQRGSVMRLDIGSIDGPGLIRFDATGQAGGSGGAGGPGGQGGQGETGGNSRSGIIDCRCGGGDGGAGGNGGAGGVGGTGGAGGDGGAIVLSPRTKEVRQRLNFVVDGGAGGGGGAGGSGGGAGNGGGGGGGGGFCGGGHGAGPGSGGANGPVGATGATGRSGLVVEF